MHVATHVASFPTAVSGPLLPAVWCSQTNKKRTAPPPDTHAASSRRQRAGPPPPSSAGIVLASP